MISYYPLFIHVNAHVYYNQELHEWELMRHFLSILLSSNALKKDIIIRHLPFQMLTAMAIFIIFRSEYEGW